MNLLKFAGTTQGEYRMWGEYLVPRWPCFPSQLAAFSEDKRGNAGERQWETQSDFKVGEAFL